MCYLCELPEPGESYAQQEARAELYRALSADAIRREAELAKRLRSIVTGVGTFRIEIQAVGGHGAAREILDGGKLDLERVPAGHVDHVIHEAVASLRQRGASVESAKLIHWPGQPSEVVDDALTGRRHGSF